MCRWAIFCLIAIFSANTAIAADIYGEWAVPEGQFKIFRDDSGTIFLKIDNKGDCSGNYELSYGTRVISNDPKDPEKYTRKEQYYSMGQTTLAQVTCDFLSKKIIVNITEENTR